MTIPQVKAEDRGIYRCLADNAVRPPSYIDCRLIVFFRPRAKAIQTTYGQAENRQFNLIIECRIAGILNQLYSSLYIVDMSVNC